MSYPRDSKLFPQVRKSFPQDSKLFPQDNKSFPHVRKSFPQDSKLFPQVRKSFPQDSKLFPQVRNLLPQDTNLLPKDTIMVIILSILIVILLSYLISDLQRSSSCCYRLQNDKTMQFTVWKVYAICSTANTSFAASRYITCMRIQWRSCKVCCAKKHPVQCNILKYLRRTKESAIKQAPLKDSNVIYMFLCVCVSAIISRWPLKVTR